VNAEKEGWVYLVKNVHMKDAKLAEMYGQVGQEARS
jgi:hypothetical protein